MGAYTTIIGSGLSGGADNDEYLMNSITYLTSNIILSTSSTYVSGGFDSIGNSYTTRPIAVTDVSVRVGRYQSQSATIKPIFRTNISAPPLVNSTVLLDTGTLAVGQDTTLSTESTYIYPVFANSSTVYYGFQGISGSGIVEYGRGGDTGDIYYHRFINNTFNLIDEAGGADKLDGSITQVSIPSAPGNVNAPNVTDTTANITWTAPADDGMQSPAAYNASNIKGYRINYRNSSLENWKVLVANTGSNSLSATINELTPSKYYEVQVAALNAVTDEHNKKIFYTGNESPFDSSITAHVGVRSATYSFTTAVSTHDIRVWTGTTFKKGIVKIWDGSAFLQYPNITAKVWSGTAFKDVPLSS
jgi:hypothetical protein